MLRRMLRRSVLVTAVLLNIGIPSLVGAVASFPPAANTVNFSTVTSCAEDDNVNISLSGDVHSFLVEATHPTYDVGADNCAADFTNCPGPSDPTYSFSPATYKLFDNGLTVVEAVRESSWWRPNGMAFSVNGGAKETDIHYFRIYRKIADVASWPQVLVMYMDGNMRLIPHPPAGRTNVCFGSSVIVGPAAPATRPIAEIATANYVTSSDTIELTYAAGGSAVLSILEVNRTRARVRVGIRYSTSDKPFATFRSMFVTEGNADVGRISWEDAKNVSHDEGVVTYAGGQGRAFSFYRSVYSKHNVSAPNISMKFSATSLWTRSDTGQAALWESDSTTGALWDYQWLYSSSGVGSPWRATSYRYVDAATGYVLWSRSDTGQAALWKVDPSGIGTSLVLPINEAAYLYPVTGVGGPWQATSYAHVSSTEGYVLWTRSDTGQAALWKVDPSGIGTSLVLPITGAAYLYAVSGVGGPWQASSYAHVSSTEGYVLWTRSDTGQAALWKVDPSGIGTSLVLPITGAAYLYAVSGVGGLWQATSYTHVSSTEGYVLWTRSDTGQAALWQVEPGTLSNTVPIDRSWYLNSSSGVGAPWQATSYGR